MSCVGTCCERISIPYHPKELRAAYDAWYNKEKHYVDDEGEEQPIPRHIHLVYPMLKFLGYSKIHPASAKELEFVEEIGTQAFPVYSCKHLTKDKLCSIYEIRPDVCRTYPDGTVCKFKGCTLGANPKPTDWPKNDGKGDDQC